MKMFQIEVRGAGRGVRGARCCPLLSILTILFAVFVAGAPAQAQFYGKRTLDVGKSAATDNDATKKLMALVGVDQKMDAVVPVNARFRDHNGKEVRLGSLLGERPVLLMMISYACTQLCTVQVEVMVQSMKEMEFRAGKEFDVIIASIDPSETSVTAGEARATFLKRYERKGVESGVHFLSGSQESITALTKATGFRYTLDKRTGQWIHPDAIMLLTPQGHVSRYFLQLKYDPRDLRLGVVEASRNRIGSALDYLALACFHWNPNESRYGFGIMSVLRLLGTVTLLLMAFGIMAMVRHERRAKSQKPDEREPKLPLESGLKV